jgi:hypothetical protein
MRNRSVQLGILVAALVSCLFAGSALAEEHRLVTQGSVNGRPARMVLDTGTSFPLAMPRNAMEKYDLQLDEAQPVDPSAAGVLDGFTKASRIELSPAYVSEDAVFAVLKDALPDTLEWDMDAIVGWAALRDDRLHYGRRKGIALFGASPSPAAGWPAFPILESNVLTFDAGSKDRPLAVLLDTGWAGGVQLSPELWSSWRAQNSHRPHTLVSVYSPSFGLVVMEQVFAERIEIGGAALSNVLVSELPPSQGSGSVEPQVVLGMAAFANHEFLVDGISRKLYIAPADHSPAPPDYNRLGATFVPGTMAARVAPNSPAAAADVQDGDVLVAIDGLEPGEYAAKLTTHNVWEQPAGTALTLTMIRGGDRITRRVVLQNYLAPPAPRN